MSKIELLQGDCLELMKNIPDNSVDLIVTDPPYLHVKGGMKSKKFNVGTWKSESYTNTKMNNFGKKEIYDFLNLADTKMKKTNMYIFCSKLQLEFYFSWISKHNKKYDLLIWNKQKKAMKSTKFFTSDIDYVIKIYQDGVSLNKITGEDGKAIYDYYTKIQSYSQPKGLHETMKPLELIEKYIMLSSNKNDIILDMFMGSGTTGVACVNTNRNFIGIELDENYFNIAKDRINQAVKDKEKNNGTNMQSM